MSRAVWSIVAPFCVVLAVLAVVTIARESSRAPDAAAGPADTVSMEGTRFAPATIDVAVGAEITFDNNDVAPHTVTADEGAVDTGIIDPGKAVKVTANETFTYHCEIHPSMTAEVRVGA